MNELKSRSSFHPARRFRGKFLSSSLEIINVNVLYTGRRHWYRKHESRCYYRTSRQNSFNWTGFLPYITAIATLQRTSAGANLACICSMCQPGRFKIKRGTHSHRIEQRHAQHYPGWSKRNCIDEHDHLGRRKKCRNCDKNKKFFCC